MRETGENTGGNMEQVSHLIIDLSLILISAGIITVIFRKLKLPVVLGYILVGFLISPNFVWLPTIVEPENINVWAELGIIFLMFALGLKFTFKKLAAVGPNAIVTGITVMTAMMLIGVCLGHLLGWSRMDSLFLGAMVCISSTMIIMKSYEEYGLGKEKFANLVMGTMIVEDVVAIFLMIVLSALSIGQSVSGLVLVSEIGILLALLAVWLVVGIYLIPTILKKIKNILTDEVLLIVSLGICFGMVAIAHLIGFSVALGAFIAGSILGGTLSGEKINQLISPIKDLFVAVFFVSVGMMIEPLLLVEYWKPILIISLVTIFGQMIFATLGILFSGQRLETAIRGGMSMVQIGEFSFVIAALGVSLGVISDFLYPTIVCVSVITIFTTPIFIKSSQKVAERVESIVPSSTKKKLRNLTTNKKPSGKKDTDWSEFLRLYFIRNGIVIVSLLSIYYIIEKMAMPYLEKMEGDYFYRIILGLIVIGLIIPLVGIMGVRRSAFFTKLWIKSKYNRLPLVALRSIRIIIAIIVIVAIYRQIFMAPYWALIPVATVIVFITVRSDFLKGQTIKMEAQFVSNFNERVLYNWKNEYKQEGKRPWLSDRLFVAEFKILEEKENLRIETLFDKRFFDILPIKVIRKGKSKREINRKDLLKKGDILHVVSTKEHLESFLMAATKIAHLESDKTEIITIKEYMYEEVFNRIPATEQIVCVAIPITKETPFAKKSIRNSKIQREFEGAVVGMEKSGTLPIVIPSISTILQEGDIVWLMGREKMVQKLLKAGLMEETIK